MDGFGAALERAFIAAIVIAFVGGGLVTLGLWWLVSWLWTHVVISWS